MSLPEISRRCLTCGASVRAGARFCPQCGSRVAGEGGDARAEGQATAAGGEAGAGPRPESPTPTTRTAPAWAEDEKEPLDLTPPASATVAPPRETAAPTRETAAPTRHTTPPTRDAVSPADGRAGESRPGGSDAAAGAPPAEAEGGRPRRAAARVRETVMPRVERMRDEAMVVLEESPDDSGLRFVVIAVALFALFLLFLLLSTTVLR